MTETKALAPQQQAYVSIRDFLSRKNVKDELAAVAAAHLDPERLLSLILSHTKRSDLLLKSTPESLLDCLRRCAVLGIEPTGAPGGMYIVPFKGSKKINAGTKQEKWIDIYVATPISDYRAEIDLAARTGLALAVEARIVYDGDTFEHEEGSNPRVVHKPGLTYQVEGKETLTYARALLPNGTYTIEVLYKPEIERRRKMSRSGEHKNAPWKTHYWRMAMKSASRALCNRLPKSAKFFESPLGRRWLEHQEKERLVDFGDETEAGLVIDAEVAPAGDLPTSRTEQLADKLKRKDEMTDADWEAEQARRADEQMRGGG